MKTLRTIEKSISRPGEYTGYADGAWIVRRAALGGWKAIKQQPAPGGRPSVYHGRTLGDIDAALTAHALNS